jgi:hypothetical protein
LDTSGPLYRALLLLENRILNRVRTWLLCHPQLIVGEDGVLSRVCHIALHALTADHAVDEKSSILKRLICRGPGVSDVKVPEGYVAVGEGLFVVPTYAGVP